jgi:hypothetical protein
VGKRKKFAVSGLQYGINEYDASQRENFNKTRWRTAYSKLRRARDKDK